MLYKEEKNIKKKSGILLMQFYYTGILKQSDFPSTNENIGLLEQGGYVINWIFVQSDIREIISFY